MKTFRIGHILFQHKFILTLHIILIVTPACETSEQSVQLIRLPKLSRLRAFPYFLKVNHPITNKLAAVFQFPFWLHDTTVISNALAAGFLSAGYVALVSFNPLAQQKRWANQKESAILSKPIPFTYSRSLIFFLIPGFAHDSYRTIRADLFTDAAGLALLRIRNYRRSAVDTQFI
jgi:hypothetical protein